MLGNGCVGVLGNHCVGVLGNRCVGVLGNCCVGVLVTFVGCVVSALGNGAVEQSPHRAVAGSQRY